MRVKRQDPVSAYLCVLGPSIWLLVLALFVAGSHGNPLEDVLTFLCEELPLSLKC